MNTRSTYHPVQDARRRVDVWRPGPAIGFTAHDRGDESLAASGPLRALHLAGRSEHKGTRQVLEAWRRHPEWPERTVVRRPLDRDSVLELPSMPNVRYITERLNDAEVLALQRQRSFHVLPSEVEGYGQALVEGLSVGAVVVTTDAPPMNDIVAADRGILVAAHRGESIRLGRSYRVDVDALEAAVADALNWSVERRSALGAAARAWFVANDRRFRQHFPQVLRELRRTGREPS
jgi:glycosyltransferase involved in cell wall biosynthesis